MSCTRLYALLALLAACGPQAPMTTDGDGSTGGGSTAGPATTATTTATTTTSTTTAPGLTTTAEPTGTTAVDPGTGSTSSTATTVEGTFIAPFDGGCFAVLGEHEVRCSQCDNWVQDCPPGEKCSPYSGDGDDAWESLKCVPLDRQPGHAGDPCTIEGSPVSGIDSCDIDTMCYHVDPDTLTGTCVPFCDGAPDAPECPAGTTCLLANEGVINLCLPRCDPLGGTCPAGEVCIPNPSADDAFICVPDGSGDQGQAFDDCTFHAACDPGLFCGPSELAGECDPDAPACCLPYCDLTMPACPGAMQECQPFFEMGAAPEELKDLGLCALPG